jgi:2-C-methyl-D-erythritol 2,4-cyclodiphosphate synthase
MRTRFILVLPAAASCFCSPSFYAGQAAPRTSAACAKPDEPQLRIGHGYDIHRLDKRAVAGQLLVIGGVRFDGTDAPDSELGVVAHSDGDVIYHSVVDAVLGALSLPDIGQLFPDNDPKYKGGDSEVFMAEACRMMVDRGYTIGNCDVTLILQRPKVNVEHHGRLVKGVMCANVARLLRTTLGRVNVKARTHEQVDAVGEGRAVECHVVLTLERDEDGTAERKLGGLQ